MIHKRALGARTARHGRITKLVLRRSTILPSELQKVVIVKDSGQRFGFDAIENLMPGTLVGYTRPPIRGRYASFLGRVTRGSNGQPVVLLTHKNKDGIYTRLARPVPRKLTRTRRVNMLVQMQVKPEKIGAKARAARKFG